MTVETPTRSRFRRARVRALRRPRSPFASLLFVAIGIGLVAIVAYLIVGDDPRFDTDITELSATIERVEELATLKSHLRFAVVVREESGNIIVRRLADQTEGLGMNSIGSMLFEDPTLIVELHGVATYGVKLDGIGERISTTDSSVVVELPEAQVLDVKLVSADTRIIAQMKGLFRSNNQELLAEANRRGERFVAELAAADSTLLGVATERTRDIVALIVEQSGARAEFR